ncbi:Cytochrome P450 [Seminavis robusta]|uniref:Cytochrome P450 n=1 Tax=Seminavis robusta TaxID=568900 RepID=A0A9N8DBQ1_9STRA|nr:Cytochrome P450 [Seminavis robusta]|eukprot:Sro75_g041150.1 Cytochrome P450 (541) ;mRNA; r:49572-51337
MTTISDFFGSEPSTSVVLGAGTALFLVCCYVYDLFYGTNKKKFWRTVPGRVPFIGHMHLLGLDLGKILPKLYEWADKYGQEDGGYEFHVHLGRVPVVCSEDRFLELSKYRPFKVRRDPHFSESFRSIGAEGLVTAEGHCWGNQRRIIAPTMNKKNVEDYLRNMKMIATRLIDNWDRRTEDGSSVIINDGVFAMMADILSIAGYGMDLDFINKSDSVLGQDVLHLLTASVFRLMAPFPYWRIPLVGQYLDGAGFRKDRIMKLIGSYVDEYTGNQESLDETQRRTFLGKLFESMKDTKSKITRELMVGNLMTMFMAGTDTNTQAILFCIWKLAADETGLQQELFDEVRDFDVASCTHEDLTTRLPKLKSFMHEVHRYYSGFPVQILEAIDEIVLGGKTIPAYTPFLILMRYPSINKVNPSKMVPIGPKGEQPSEFCPRRWLVTTKDGALSAMTPNTTNNCSFMAFGVGARACPGRIYSEAMTFLTIISLLQRFQISLEAGHEPIFPVFMHIDTVNRDIKLQLKKRSETYVPPSFTGIGPENP